MNSSHHNEAKRRAQDFVRRLERHPELLDRFESILELSRSDELQTLDELKVS